MNIFKTQKQLITEIHNAFDTAQDRLLSEAHEILLKVKTEEQPIERLAERLKAVGFVQTPVTKEAEKFKKHRDSVVKTREEAELIEYYKRTYPFLKFLTEKELEKICDKYNLVFAPVANYKENVPEKNLRDIECAQILRQEDARWDNFRMSVNQHAGSEKDFLKAIGKTEPVFTEPEYEALLQNVYGAVPNDWKLSSEGFSTGFFVISDRLLGRSNTVSYGRCERISRDGLFIAAPKSHFDLKGLTKKNKHGFFNVTIREVKDPIVFRYVRGGIQVLTKWGLEANDPALVLPITN